MRSCQIAGTPIFGAVSSNTIARTRSSRLTANPCATTSFGGTNFGAKVKSFTQHDVTFTYNLPIDAVDAQLQFGVENFTDADPPASRLEVSYDPFIGNPFGRIFRFGINTKF